MFETKDPEKVNLQLELPFAVNPVQLYPYRSRAERSPCELRSPCKDS